MLNVLECSVPLILATSGVGNQRRSWSAYVLQSLAKEYRSPRGETQ